MVLCYYKKIVYSLLISLLLQVFAPATIFANRILWPSEMNLDNDLITLDNILPKDATASNSKKGFLFSGDPKEIFILGAGHIAINVTLSGKGHTMIQYLQGLKKRGVKITLILVNDKAPVGVDLKSAPEEFQKPYFYMIDFNSNNGDWQRYNFDRIVSDYYPYVDNWIIGNEINSQLYNFYGASDVNHYTKVYCDTFKICYEKIKAKNPNANVYISFDQGYDIPNYDARDRRFNKVLGKYRYNMKEQLILINNYLDRSIDWGVALHPYPAPIESAYFWDDEYAGYDVGAKNEVDMPYLLTLKNFEIAINFLAEKRFLNRQNKVRNIIISEFALTSHDGEREQAAGLYYLWEKIENNPYVKAFLYNSQTDLADGYNFGLTSDKNRKRLIWAVFKDMDRENERGWCKDLLDEVLEEHGYIDIDTVIFNKASISELLKTQ
ncbi:MAG: hypothetical protein J6P02_05390 [Lachnospiraceae bacterium]|nr:hypothetical protein [Lachnospiraceae bacterium]